MGILAVRHWANLDAAEQGRLLARSTAAVFEPGLQASIEAIFEDVRQKGDEAVLDATERFDGVRFAAGDLRVRPEELAAAHDATDPALLAGIREAIHNSRLFNAAQVRATALGWLAEVRPGFELGEQVSPIPSAGLYVPAGKGSFPSVLVQIGVPAVVAGVPEIAVLVPPAARHRRGRPCHPRGRPRAGPRERLPGERPGRDRRAHVRHGDVPARAQDRRARAAPP